jgi:hypothetical protein
MKKQSGWRKEHAAKASQSTRCPEKKMKLMKIFEKIAR